MKVLLFSAVLLFTFTGCTDAEWDSIIGKLNNPAKITCYSGNIKISEGYSTGAVMSAKQSDGYQYRNKTTGKFMEVSGNCVIEYED